MMTTQQLLSADRYGPAIADKVQALGPMAISIANRWMLGWPKRVQALLDADLYLGSLEEQVAQEKNILAQETDLRHLAPHEILALYEIRVAPPAMG
jgi:hypothetical protein